MQDPAPLEGVGTKVGLGLPCYPWSCLLDLLGLLLRCDLCSVGSLVGFVCLVPWWAQQHGGAACGPGRMFHSSEWRTRCASSQKRMSELASGASLLGMDNCSPGQVLDNLPIFLLNVPGWFSHKSVFLTPCSAHRQHTREETGCWREAERGARGNEGLSYKTSQK